MNKAAKSAVLISVSLLFRSESGQKAEVNRFKSAENTSEKRRFKFRIPLELNEQNQKLLGITLMGGAVFFLLAFISFIFSFQTDFSKVEIITSKDFFSIEPKSVSNWMGKLGAYFSYKFIYSWFGVTAFVFPFIMFVHGVRHVFKTQLVPLEEIFSFFVFGILWFPIFTSILAHGKLDYLAGGYGVYANLWLKTVVGAPGLVIALAVSLIGFVLIKFNLTQRTKTEGSAEDHSSKEDESPKNDEHQPEQKEEIKPTPKPITSEREVDFEPVKKETPKESKPEIKTSFEVEVSKDVNPTPEPEPEVQGLEIEKAQDDSEKVTELTHGDDYDPTLDLSNYKYPTLDLLKEYEVKEQTVDAAELEQRKDLIVATLANYKIDIEKIKATIGPTVTLFEIIPAPGVRISKIKNLEDDIALSLSALGIRIIAPIPGKGTIGIEVPNAKPEMVSMRDVVSSSKFRDTDKDLPVVFGRTISNEIFVTDLAKMPHLLMAGATGQGKSVGLNVILASLLYKKHPSQVKFVLVDPKKVELSLYKHIERHFLAKLPDEEEAIITDTSKVIDTLNSLCAEMDQRYDLLKVAQVRNIKEYNQKFLKRRLNPENGHRFLPYIVLVIDELADLMMTAGKEVETPIARLAQLARAIGIHLIIATQRPSVNIITGIIKANFPTRLAFRVTSKVDSRTILDSGGADQLVGRGDMLYSEGGEPIRIQCAFVDTPEIEGVCEFIGDQQGYGHAFFLPEVAGESGGGNGAGPSEIDDVDPLFDDAARTIVQNQMGSTSLLQRRLKLGYNRAGRLIDQLERAGVVGPHEGSKAREVLIPDEYALEQFLSEFHKK